jgi:hypothetical protein
MGSAQSTDSTGSSSVKVPIGMSSPKEGTTAPIGSTMPSSSGMISPTQENTTPNSVATTTATSTSTSVSAAPNTTQKPKPVPVQLTSYSDVQQYCSKKRTTYEACYSHWWKMAFTAGKLEAASREDCDDLYERYESCVTRGMKRVVKHNNNNNTNNDKKKTIAMQTEEKKKKETTTQQQQQ